MKLLPKIDIIDLDEPSYQEIGARERAITLHLTVLYALGKIPNSDLITMKVFIGLLPAIPLHKQKALPQLALFLASIGLTYTDLSVLMRAIMVMDEIKRIFSLEEQEIILSYMKRNLS